MLWLKHDDTPVDITITYYIFFELTVYYLHWKQQLNKQSQVKYHKLAYSAAFNFITRF